MKPVSPSAHDTVTSAPSAQLLGRIAAADHRRDAQFAGDDRRVAGAPAAVGDDGGGALHHRLPVRVGHVGDQHVAGLHVVHLGQRAHHAHPAGADLLADGAALGQHGAVALQLVAVLDLACAGSSRSRAAPAGCRACRRRRPCPTRCPSAGRSAARSSARSAPVRSRRHRSASSGCAARAACRRW